MFSLINTAKAWQTALFESTLKTELSKLQAEDLSLQQETRYSGMFVPNSLEISLLSCNEQQQQLNIKVGIFFQEYMTTCPCSGEETEIYPGYSEKNLLLQLADGQARIINN